MNTVRHILESKRNDILWVIEPKQSVFEALRRMADKDIGALLVMDNDQLLGIITERDYARKVVLMGHSSREMLVEEIMQRDPVTIHPDQTLEEAMELMSLRKVHYLPVMETDHEVLGVISIGDVVKRIIYRQRETIKNLAS